MMKHAVLYTAPGVTVVTLDMEQSVATKVSGRESLRDMDTHVLTDELDD